MCQLLGFNEYKTQVLRQDSSRKTKRSKSRNLVWMFMQIRSRYVGIREGILAKPAQKATWEWSLRWIQKPLDLWFGL